MVVAAGQAGHFAGCLLLAIFSSPAQRPCRAAFSSYCTPLNRPALTHPHPPPPRRHQLGDVGWQPSKLELEAQLGASRERQAELEWRLAAMETMLKQHSALLVPAGPAAPLGSLLDAIDDGHVSPPRSKVRRAGGGWDIG